METARDVKLRITELNPHLICALCGGYLIDATTVVECLHSFCKTCILRYLETSNYCPICEVLIHKTRPWQNIRLDHTLQTIVYKVVPGLFKAEMKRRREFYDKTPATSGTRLAVDETLTSDRIIYSPDENISVCLRYCPDGKPPQVSSSTSKEQQVCRYLLCPAAVTMHHLKKIIRLKSTVPDKCQIDVFHTDEPLRDHHSLMDVAYIYSWRRQGVMKLYYSFYEPPPRKRKRVETEAIPPDVVKDTDVMTINEMKTEPEDAHVTKTHKDIMAKLPNGDLASPSSASDSISSTPETCDIMRSAEVCSNADDVTMSPSPEQMATDLRKDSNKSSPLSPSAWNSSPVSAPILPPSSSNSCTHAAATPTPSSLSSSTPAMPSSSASVSSKGNSCSSRSSSVSKSNSATTNTYRSSGGSCSTKTSGGGSNRNNSSSSSSRCGNSNSSHTLLPAPAHASSKPKLVSDSFAPKNLMKRSESKPVAPPAHSIASITGSVLFGPHTSSAHQPMRKELSSLYVAADGAAMTDHGPVRSSHAAEAAAAATSPGEPEKSPAKDARKPSDMEHLFATGHSRWHHPHPHSHPHSELVYNGHYPIAVRDRYPQDLKGDLPLDFSQSSTSTSS